MENLHRVGCISVDAGLVMVGDPCYVLHKDPNAEKDYDKPSKSIGKSWSAFCEILQGKDLLQIDHDSGAEGLGVVVGGFGGDGVYPVFVEKDDSGRVVRLVVDFCRN